MSEVEESVPEPRPRYPQRVENGPREADRGADTDEASRKRARMPFPATVYRYGRRPDPRFSLANERTLLAWVRTSLALIAGGVALEALHLPIQEDLRFVAAIVFLLLGLLSAGQAWFGWVRTERALRRDRTLPAPTLGLVLVVGVGIVIALLVLGFLW